MDVFSTVPLLSPPQIVQVPPTQIAFAATFYGGEACAKSWGGGHNDIVPNTSSNVPRALSDCRRNKLSCCQVNCLSRCHHNPWSVCQRNSLVGCEDNPLLGCRGNILSSFGDLFKTPCCKIVNECEPCSATPTSWVKKLHRS